MNVLVWLLLGVIVFVLWKSIVDFIVGRGGFSRSSLKKGVFSFDLFYALIMLYSTIIIGFALIYFGLSYQGVILIEHGEVRDISALESLVHSIYFSGVTLLTIGYGDIIPVGIGRIIALIEAMIGYLLPTAFVFRLLTTRSKDHE